MRRYFGRAVASGSHQTSIRMVEAGEVHASGIDSTMLDVERRRRPELSTAPALKEMLDELVAQRVPTHV